MRRILIVTPLPATRIAAVLTSLGLVLGASLALPVALHGQSSSSSSSSSAGARDSADLNPVARPRAAQIEPGGAAVTLEYSEPLFQLASALNACGYDDDLEISVPVRTEVRSDMNAALAASEPARASRDALCAYIERHRLNDIGLDVGQYVSLALYLSPPPELTPNVSELELPPQASAVVNVLPLLRTFSQQVGLHFIWLRHRAQYEALAQRVHGPMTQMILDTNIYLHQPVSSYDGRRFLVLLEPMLSPNLTNARIYGSDYIIVTSPERTTGDPVRMDQIRHIYLHYVVEPMVYSRGSAMERIQPLLRGVQDAPLEFFYKSDVEALITECLIKAIEARTYQFAPPPSRLTGSHSRAEVDQHAALLDVYDRESALARQKLVTTDESQGWVLTSYFYNQLITMEHNGDGLRDEIAAMIYGMDVDRQRKHAEEIVFAKGAPADPLRPSARPRPLQGMDLAEMDLLKGDLAAAAELAEKALAQPGADPSRPDYLLARIHLMQGEPDEAQAGFEKALATSKDPRTLAWSHIYLGRLYDIQTPPARDKAVAEYKAALAVRDGRPDTRQAADAGLAKPFQLPQREGQPPPATKDPDDEPFDPTGKAEKQAYKPGQPN